VSRVWRGLVSSRRFVLIVVGVVWVAAIAFGFNRLWAYAGTPAPQGTAPAEWPASSRLARVDGRPTIVMFAHPQCPCSRATVTELEKLVARTHAAAAIHVVFYRPAT
jgi:hypothetical protein